MEIPKHIIVFLIVAFNHDFCSIFWSKQVTDTQSGMVSTPKIPFKSDAQRCRLCAIMRDYATGPKNMHSAQTRARHLFMRSVRERMRKTMRRQLCKK